MTDAAVDVSADAGHHLVGLDVVRTDINSGDKYTNSVSFPAGYGSYVHNFSTNLEDLVGDNRIENVSVGVDKVQLVINNPPYGSVNPSGTNFYNWGDSVSVSLAGSPETNNLERYVSEGWTLSDGQDDSGSGTSANFTLTNSATLGFDSWKTQYVYSATAGENGNLTGVTNGWHDAGDVVNTEAVPGDYHHFSGWTGDSSSTNQNLELTIDSPKSVSAEFDVNRTARGVPETWYAEHGMTIDDNANADSDPYVNWQEWELDTNPTNANDYFYTSMAGEDVLLKNTSTNVKYGVDYRDSLTSGDWTPYTNGVSGNEGDTLISGGQEGFYRGFGSRSALRR
jgi:hypothetical protein